MTFWLKGKGRNSWTRGSNVAKGEENDQVKSNGGAVGNVKQQAIGESQRSPSCSGWAKTISTSSKPDKKEKPPKKLGNSKSFL